MATKKPTTPTETDDTPTYDAGEEMPADPTPSLPDPEPRAPAFDPSKYIRLLSGQDYLEVKWRLVWVRDRHPDASITTKLEHLDEVWLPGRDGGAKVPRAIFSCRVTIPGGGDATGWGSETLTDFKDYVEKAETKAIGRALAALGFGTQFSAWEYGGEADAGRVVDAPVDFASTRGRRLDAQAPPAQRPTPQRPPQQQQGNGRPPSAITPRQRKWIEDLIAKQGDDPAQFASVLDAMAMDTASEWIKQLQEGAQPWVTASVATDAKVVPHPTATAAPAQSIEQSEAMMRKLLKLNEPLAEQREDWSLWIASAGDEHAKWQNLARQARHAVKYAKKPEEQGWRYVELAKVAPTKPILSGLYDMAQEDVVYSPEMERAIEDRLVAFEEAEAGGGR